MTDGSGPARPKPLSGIRVLDLSRLLPGPMATLHLADLGADVIRFETIYEAAPLQGPDALPNARTLADLCLHRNKRAVSLDLRQAAGRDIFLRLAKEADVVVEGFRPGVVDRLGIGYKTVRHLNPRIVYCSITGYGQTGPDRLRAGHDINYLARSGAGDQIGLAGGPPAIPNLQIGDLLGGSLTAVMGLLAALIDVRARGTGRYVDVSMTDSLLAHSLVALSTMLSAGRPAGPGDDALSGGLPCYNYYRTRDGRYLAVGALEPKFWERLCDALERPDLKPKHMARGEEGRRVRDELGAVFAAQSSDRWEQVFRDVDCCVTLVLTLDEAIHSSQARAREMIFETEHPLRGKLIEFAPPLKMSDLEPSVDSPAAREARQTVEILLDAGYSPDEIAAFRASGVIG